MNIKGGGMFRLRDQTAFDIQLCPGYWASSKETMMAGQRKQGRDLKKEATEWLGQTHAL